MIKALKYLAGILGAFVSLVSLIVGCLVIANIVSEVLNERIVVERFSTPEFFQKNGYSETVAAYNIKRSIDDIRVNSATLFDTGDFSELQLAWTQPDIAVPETDISTEWIVRRLKNLFGGELTTVGGEFVCHQEHLAVNLRIERLQYEHPLYVHIHAAEKDASGCQNTEQFDQLVDKTAEHIWEHLQPYVFAVYLYRIDRMSPAESVAKRLTFLPPVEDDSWAYNLLGLIEMRRAKRILTKTEGEKPFAKAELLFRKATEIDPAFVPAKANLARIALDAGRIDKSIEMYRDLIIASGRRAKRVPTYVISGQGEALFLLGSAEKATAYFRRAVVQEPNNAIYHFNLGLGLNAQEKLSEAIEEFEIAIVLDPTHIKARYKLGRALFELKSDEAYRRAATVDSELFRLIGDDPIVLYNWGLALEHLSSYAEAEDKYRQAIRKKPDKARYHKVLGDVLFSQEKYKDALESYTRAMDLNPDAKLTVTLRDKVAKTKAKLNETG